MAEEHWEKMSITHHDEKSLWDNALSYFAWCKDNPIELKKKLMSGNQAGTDTTVTKIRPYSLKALCLHCGLTEDFFRDLRNTKDKDSLYYQVATRILYNIWVQNYEMGLIDEYNSIMVMKVLGMDKEEVQVGAIKVEIVPGLPQLSESENEILAKLESEKGLDENTKEEITKDKTLE